MNEIFFIQLGSVTAKIEVTGIDLILDDECAKEKDILLCWDDFTPIYNIQFLETMYHHSSFGMGCKEFDNLSKFIKNMKFKVTYKDYKGQLPF